MTKVINIAHLLTEGMQKEAQTAMLEESKKGGTFRGGSIGMISEDGDWTGTCGRLALLRFLGFYKQAAPDRPYMFAAGETNEDSWIKSLKASSFDGYILTQEQVQIKRELDSGRFVTGRPDIVLADTNKIPLQGIELKLICSVWTARTVLQGTPKLHHAIQAGFYSDSLQIPYDIWYTNRSDFVVMGNWMIKLFPKKGELLSSYMEYNDKGEAKKVIPFALGFNLKWIDGTLFFRQVESSGRIIREWCESIVTSDRIMRFYSNLEEYIPGNKKSSLLPPKPSVLDIFGEKENYTACQYCELQTHCLQYESNRKEWLERLPSEFVDLSKLIED